MLKRTYARLSMILLGAVAVLYCVLAYLTYIDAPQFILMVLNIIAPAVLVGVVIFRVALLRCPHCGEATAKPYWKPRPEEVKCCPKCGGRLLYDDEV